MIALELATSAQGVVLASATLAAVLYIGHKGRAAYKAASSFVRRIDKVIENVESQLYPNGGRSLRDAVDRIQERLGIEDNPPEVRQ
jgi:hypothetical protein